MSPSTSSGQAPQEVLIAVALKGTTYHARAGAGKGSKTATSTACGPFAVLAAASKYLQVPEEKITLSKASPGVFKATVITTEEAK